MKSLLCPLFAAFLLAMPAAPAFAQGKKFALVVGVKEYEHSGFSDLKHTENDAEELAKLLNADSAFTEVIVLTSTRGKSDEALRPTSKNIRDQLKKLSDKVTKTDILLVALAGHGLQVTVVDPADPENEKKHRSESFFCPADARPREKGTRDDLKQTMIPLLELFEELGAAGAGVKLMLVDACRNEARLGSRNLDVDNLPKPSRGTAVLFSCKSGERAFETDKLGAKGHGVFFHFVIEGLKGEARNLKGEVTWTRLADYVVENVSEQVRKVIGDGAEQTPHELKNIEGKPPVLLLRPEEKAVPADEKPNQAEKPKEDAGKDEEKVQEEKARPDEEGKKDDKASPNNRKRDGDLLKDHDDGDEEDPEKEQREKEERERKEREQKEKEQKEKEERERKEKEEREQREKEERERKEKSRPKADPDFNKALDAAFGLKGRVNHAAGVALLRRAAANGHAPARGMLGWMTYLGRGTRANREDGARMIKEALPGVAEAARGGDAGSLYLLASLHLAGLGVERDRDQAKKLALAAAERDFAPAMRLLANMAAAEKDHAAEVGWYRKAAELGYVPAMLSVARCYARGRGVSRDDAAALRWYRKAAAGGDAEAMFQVAYCVEQGRGVERDVCLAVKMYAEAAEKGSTSAMYRLGCLLMAGEGVRKDCKAALCWHAKAAAAGDERSMYEIGRMYEDGRGVCRSQGEAVKWYAKASGSGHKGAAQRLRACR